MISWACLLLLIAVSSLFPSIFFFFAFSLSVNDFYALLKHVGALREDLNATFPLFFFFFFFSRWISAFFSASLWWRQGSFKPGSAHGRLLSQRCPLSTVLACWRKRGWGSSLADPVIPRKAYMSTHAGILIRRWSLFSQESRMSIKRQGTLLSHHLTALVKVKHVLWNPSNCIVSVIRWVFLALLD